MRKTLSISSMLTVMLLSTFIFSAATPSWKEPGMEANQSISLIVTPMRELYGMPTDFDALVESSVQHYAFTVTCQGAPSITIDDLTHDNPVFQPGWTAKNIQCGSIYWFSFSFSPTNPGITTDNVTFLGQFGKVTKQLVGNGIPTHSADQWIADLAPGTSANRLVYDNQRDLVYITDSGNDQVIVFSPEQQGVVASITVGLDPVGLAITPDSQKLYVANSGEHSVSVIDLSTQTELEKIPVPTLYPNPTQPYHFEYMPYEIAVVSNTLALLGSEPPGAASGGPIYQLDLQSTQVAPRLDLPSGSLGRYPVFRTSLDSTATGIVVEPGSSPTLLARYNTVTNSFIETSHRLERTIAINNNGTRLITTNHDCNQLIPNLAIFDQEFTSLSHIQLIGCQSVAVVFNPVNPKYVYAVDGREGNRIEEASIDSGTQTRALYFDVPDEYYLKSHALAISGDGIWIYALLVQAWNAPPSKLLAVKVGPKDYADSTAPSSNMNPLSETQVHNWWTLSWSGTDDSSGIDYYEIQYRIGQDGEWNHWLNTSGTSALFFNAIPSQQYFFRIVAYDHAGNIEPYPSDYDTYTTAGSDTSGLYQVYLAIVTKN